MADIFRLDDSALAARMLARIRGLAGKKPGAVSLMEVCGTHTVAIAKSGIRRLLPDNVLLLSGPGCPVCVSSPGDIDNAIKLSKKRGVITATFGDMMRVRGSKGSLELSKAEGADVRVVYSPLEAVELARKNKSRKVVFIGVGFETTAPAVAAAILSAKKERLENFHVLAMLKLVPPALRAILCDKRHRIDGFLLPGHVSAVIGLKPYEFVAREFRAPGVVAGFEPLDILHGISMLLSQLDINSARIENAYPRGVRKEGNALAVEFMEKVFSTCDASWRAVGRLPDSGLKIKNEFSEYDAFREFGLSEINSPEPKGCLCGAVIMGRAAPKDCALFGKKCTPRNPVGPCMVSSEGSCAAWYYYG